MNGLIRRIDPRWYILGNHIVLVTTGTLFFGLQRDLLQVAFCVGLGSATELVAAYVFKKHPLVRIGDRLLSANVACWATLVLIRSSDWWFYGVLVSIGILSKYVLVNEEGRHFFNPTNFAIVFSLAFMPDHLFVRTDQFSSDDATFFTLLPIVLGFGLAGTISAKRWRESLAYYLVVVFIGLPVGVLLGVKWLWVLGPELNTSTVIFAFLMITDPRTSPSSPRSQWIFAGTVSLVHLVMRYAQVPYSPFVALFGITGLWSVLGKYLERPVSETLAPA
jgi:Na+-translocating ferredoxin:NAD+ oxidoreductase RnfD subunit